jgi:hypothetical protein
VEPPATGWDPVETDPSEDYSSSAGESRRLESLLEQIPPSLQESLQSHLMGTFVRVRKVDNRDFLFAEATTDTLSPDSEPEILAEDNEEVD